MKGIKEWFPLYAGDWITSIQLRLCSPVERAVLIDLMAFSWEAGTPGVVTENLTDLSYFLHMNEDDLSNALAMLKQRRRIEYDGKTITIKRLQEVAGEQLAKHNKRVEAGRKGGQVKTGSQDNPQAMLSNAQAMLSNAQALEEIREDKNREEKSVHTRAPDIYIGTQKQVIHLMWKDIEDAAPRRITKNEKGRLIPVLSRILKDFGDDDPKGRLLRMWKKAMKHERADTWLSHPHWFENDYGEFLSHKKTAPAVWLLREEDGKTRSYRFKSKKARETYITKNKLKIIAGAGEQAVWS